MKYFKEYLVQLSSGELEKHISDMPQEYMLNHMVCGALLMAGALPAILEITGQGILIYQRNDAQQRIVSINRNPFSPVD